MIWSLQGIQKKYYCHRHSHSPPLPAQQRRQWGVTLVPVMVTLFMFTLLTTEVIIPLQNRTLRETKVKAAANSAEQLIQAAIAYRANPYNSGWPGTVSALSPDHLVVFTNRTPWDGTWQFTPTSGVGLVLQTNTGSLDNARALVQKIGAHASVHTDNTSVKIAVVAPADHYVQNLKVGHLTAGNIIETSNLLANIIEVAFVPSTHIETVDDLTVKQHLTMGEMDSSKSPQIKIQGNGTLDIDGTLKATHIIEQDRGGSSRRYKKNIRPLEIEANKIYQLHTVSYNYREAYKHYQKPTGGDRQLGLIAEDINAIIPELAIYQDGQPVNVDYEKLTVVMLKALQTLKKDLDALQTENQTLKEQLQAMAKTPKLP